MLLRCRWLVRDAHRVERDGAVLVDGERIAAVATGGAARRLGARAPSGVATRELDGVLAPGLVDAHVHLDLSALRGRVPAAEGFVPWIGALLRERSAADPGALLEAARAAARDLLRSGTTALGDVDTLGLSAAALADTPLRAILHREVLDGGDPARADDAGAAAARALDEPTGSPRLTRGLSPHAPHTVSPSLLAALGRLRRGCRVQVHWSETHEELEWLERAGGPFAGLLKGDASGPGAGLDRLAAAGLLDEGTSLAHGNHPRAGEPEELARRGVVLVHCPGTHAFFDRAPFPWQRYEDAGVTLALGTDSLASNDRLDMSLEMARARRALPGVAPADILAAATRGGARALGLDAGHLAPGALADMVHLACRASTADDVVEAWTTATTPLRQAWIGGGLAVGSDSD